MKKLIILFTLVLTFSLNTFAACDGTIVEGPESLGVYPGENVSIVYKIINVNFEEDGTPACGDIHIIPWTFPTSIIVPGSYNMENGGGIHWAVQEPACDGYEASECVTVTINFTVSEDAIIGSLDQVSFYSDNSDIGEVVTLLEVIQAPSNCLGDYDNDGYITSSDLSSLLAAYGSENSAIDLNGDGSVNTSDLGIFLGIYGSSCEEAPELLKSAPFKQSKQKQKQK